MEFYFNNGERRELFNFIQLKGGKFIPDVFFNSEEYLILSDYNEFSFYQSEKTTHFFLVDNRFLLEPIVTSKNRFMEEPKYSVNQREGGPYIDFSFYRGYAVDALIPYMKSSIDIYPKFIHFNSHDEFKATDELKEYYTGIVNYIKSKCSVVIKGNKKYWVGHNALKEMDLDK